MGSQAEGINSAGAPAPRNRLHLRIYTRSRRGGGANSQQVGFWGARTGLRTNDTMAGPTRSLMVRRFLRPLGQRSMVPNHEVNCGVGWQLPWIEPWPMGFQRGRERCCIRGSGLPHKARWHGVTDAANGHVLCPSRIKCMDRRRRSLRATHTTFKGWHHNGTQDTPANNSHGQSFQHLPGCLRRDRVCY
jgi:hypothetical protein